jgi:hypothetical protein
MLQSIESGPTRTRSAHECCLKMFDLFDLKEWWRSPLAIAAGLKDCRIAGLKLIVRDGPRRIR